MGIIGVFWAVFLRFAMCLLILVGECLVCSTQRSKSFSLCSSLKLPSWDTKIISFWPMEKWWMENDQPKCRVSSGGFKYTGRSSLACLEMLQHNLGRWKLVNVFADGPKCDDKHLQRFIPLMFNYLSWRENTLVIKNYCQILISVEQKNDPCIAGKALPLEGFLRINQWM